MNEWIIDAFILWHVTLKTGVNSFAITGIINILKYIQIENSCFKVITMLLF